METSLTMSSLESIDRIIQSGRRPDSIVIGPWPWQGQANHRGSPGDIGDDCGSGTPVVVDADAIGALPPGGWPRGCWGGHPARGRGIQVAGRDRAARGPLRMRRGGLHDSDHGPEDRLTGPGGRNVRGQGGHPRMAVGGTGDLLAGAIGGLMAQGMPPGLQPGWAARR